MMQVKFERLKNGMYYWKVNCGRRTAANAHREFNTAFRGLISGILWAVKAAR